MEVIALQGKSNSGKSETINFVYQMLLLNGYQQVPSNFIGPLGNPTMRDFLDVLQKGEKRVGIISQGDYAKGVNSLKTHLKTLDSMGCDKAVCACTTKLGIIKAVNAYKNTIVLKTIAPNLSLERIVNNLDAVNTYSYV